MSAWIKMIPEDEATGELRKLYAEAMTPHGTVDNVMKVHSLRPHTMHGHVTLYRSVLHHPDITLPLWFLEVVASYVSINNDCRYSLTHHFMNVRRLLNDEIDNGRGDNGGFGYRDASAKRLHGRRDSRGKPGRGLFQLFESRLERLRRNH